MATNIAPDGKPKGSRVWANGNFDLLHFGHANFLRVAKAFGKRLIVGVHSDSEIDAHRGPPIFSSDDRFQLVSAIKWVDNAVIDAPFLTETTTLNQYDCDFAFHGGKPLMCSDGKDAYEDVKRVGRYRECRRTEDISTTELVGRMMLLSKAHHESEEALVQYKDLIRLMSTDCSGQAPWTRVSLFSGGEFAEGRTPRPTDKIVYVCGAFDLFNASHLELLETAKSYGDYLIIGLFSDQVSNEVHGANYPIMSLHERLLGLLPYKVVNEVVVGVPATVSADILDKYKIKVVADVANELQDANHPADRFQVPAQKGIFIDLDVDNIVTGENIMKRIIQNRLNSEHRTKK